MSKAIAFIFLIGVILCPDVSADHISLTNGDRLTGQIVKSDGKNLVLKSEYAGTVTIKWEAVAGITPDQPLYITLNDDRLIVGQIAASEGNFEIQTEETGTVTLAKSAVKTIRSQPEHEAFEAKNRRLQNPGLFDLWSGFAEAGLSLTQGNADTSTINLAANATRATPGNKISLFSTMLYSTNNTRESQRLLPTQSEEARATNPISRSAILDSASENLSSTNFRNSTFDWFSAAG